MGTRARLILQLAREQCDNKENSNIITDNITENSSTKQSRLKDNVNDQPSFSNFAEKNANHHNEKSFIHNSDIITEMPAVQFIQKGNNEAPCCSYSENLNDRNGKKRSGVPIRFSFECADEEGSSFYENSSSDEYIPDQDELSETNYYSDSDSDILPTPGINSATHVTAETSDYHVQDENSLFSDKREKVKKKIFEPKEKTFRKKTREPEKWKRNKSAIARGKGESYLSQKGKIMPKKIICEGTLCREKCRLGCTQKFSLEAREAILKKYYTLDINAKNALLFKSILIQGVQRHRVNISKAKQFSFKYSVTYNQKVIPVCREALCCLFQFSRKKIEIIQKKLKNGECAPSPDKRGRHLNRPHKLDEDVIKNIDAHIKKFPAEASHYSRNHNPNRKYLSPVLNISIMYNLYLKECDENQLPEKYRCKRSSYSKIFSIKNNLGFGNPKSDTCSTCDSGEGTEEHKERYKLAFEKQRVDREKASIDANKMCYMTMDLQQTMPLPKLSTSKAFYLRQMWLYNFGIHTITPSGHKSYFFTWTENQANRGSAEIGSCLMRFVQLFKEEHGDNINHLVIWSDSCAGQNKNFYLISLYQYLILKGYFKKVDHKFPEVGHSYLDSDRDFGRIEQKMRLVQNIYIPDQYREIIQKASPKNSVCVDMKHFFLDIEVLPQILHLNNKKKNVLEEKVNFRDNVKWIRVSDFGSYFYKETLDENASFSEVNILKSGHKLVKAENVKVKRLEEPKGCISKEKINNLKDQLKFVKEEYRWYYEEIFENNQEQPEKKKRRTK